MAEVLRGDRKESRMEREFGWVEEYSDRAG